MWVDDGAKQQTVESSGQSASIPGAAGCRLAADHRRISVVSGLVRGYVIDQAQHLQLTAVAVREFLADRSRNGRTPTASEAAFLASLEAAISLVSRSHAGPSRSAGEIDGGSSRVRSGECTVEEAARMLGFKSSRRVQQLLATSSIEGRKTGRRWVTSYEAVRAYQKQLGGDAA